MRCIFVITNIHILFKVLGKHLLNRQNGVYFVDNNSLRSLVYLKGFEV